MSTRRPYRRNSGFTLLELLLAMALVVMLSVTLYSAFNVAYKAKARAEATVRPLRASMLAMDMIAADMEAMVPPNTATNQLVLAGGFLGENDGNVGTEADWVEFFCVGTDGAYASPPTGSTEDSTTSPFSEGIRRVDWGLRTDVTPNILVRRVTRNLLAPAEVEPPEEVICRDVQSFSVKYFDGTDWYDDWDSTQLDNAIPTVILVDLVVNLTDPKQQSSGNQPQTYHVSRTIAIPTAKPIPAGTGTSSTGTTGTTGTGTTR